MGTRDVPVHEIGGGGPVFKDYPRDSFEKVGEIDLEEDPQTPSKPIPSISSIKTLTREEPRKKMVKTLVGRTDLPWVQKLLAQQSKTSPSSRQPPTQTKQPTQPTRKSYRLVVQGFTRRSSTTKQGPPVVEETTTPTQASPVPGSEQASNKTNPPSSKRTPASWPVPKRKATSKYGPAAKSVEEPKFKRVKTLVPPSPNFAMFLRRSVVRGQIVKIGYFRE